MTKQLFQRAFNIHTTEIIPISISFILGLLLMASYYIVRPVRDAMASDWSDLEISYLWTLNFFISTLLVLIFNFASSRVKLKLWAPFIYGLFAITYCVFAVLLKSPLDQDFIRKAFYLWVSIFSLYHISIFWSLMALRYKRQDAERVFPIIAAGVSAGAILGPLIPALFSKSLPTDTFVILTSLLIITAIPISIYLTKEIYRSDSEELHTKSIRTFFDAIMRFSQSPYLIKIATFIIIHSMINSFIYLQQKNILASFDIAERTQLLAGIDVTVNILTFILTFFTTSRLLKYFGIGFTLAFIPFISGVGMLTLSIFPSVSILVALQITRRAGGYGITKPARELLFTGLKTQDILKSKAFIDVAIYRGGDMTTSWLFSFLTQGLNIGFSSISIIGAILAGTWSLLGIHLGKQYKLTGKDI